ncbi:MAG TPA: hydantoinase B/oxoprolinase family protein [Gaiellaceae bacterium]|nr:hydantoinase B/oxoprolinase family protein [Gaiellaceae bacterium]
MTAAPTTPAERSDVNDDLTIEIMRRYLISTVDEMVRTTTRTAYSTVFSEALDFTCALFDTNARMIAFAAGLPVHAGALGDMVQDVLEKFGDDFRPGDVVLHNDPYAGGTHQGDVGAVRPMYFEGSLVGFAVNRGHWADVGGMTAGGWGGAATHVIQEALIMPGVKVYRAGEVDREIRDFVLRNVRMPKFAWGDLQAQIASAITAERRIAHLCERYGVDAVIEAGQRAIDYSRDRFHKQMSVIPDGTYTAEDAMENDGQSTEPRPIKLTITKTGTDLTVDFTGSSPQVRGPINATRADTNAAVYTALINIIDPEMPINSGCLDAVEIVAPLGSIVNAVYPAPVFAGLADTTDRIYESVFLALADVVPERVTAGTYSSGNCTTGSGFTEAGDEFVWYSFGPGGCGARSWADGNSGEWHAMASCKNESAEIWENRYPLRVVDYRFRPDSAGPGRWRGGFGHVKALELTEDTSLAATIDRNVHPPFGLADGMAGACNGLTLEIDGVEQDFCTRFGTISPSKFSNIKVPKGSIYRIYAGGGGGYGAPEERPPELVAADVRAGLVTPDAARTHYKVAVDPATLELLDDETDKLRRAAA